jgi:hypothetical protein
VATPIPVEVITHMHEFLGHNHLKCPRQGEIDPFEVDQDRVKSLPMHETVRSAICG